jgi:predicted ATPase/DNA-binding XRE family transcriptional regulator
LNKQAAASFAQLLKSYRHAAGLTQEELAERAGLSARSISDLERGVKLHPYANTVRQLAQAFALDESQVSELRVAARSVEGSTDESRETFEPGAPKRSLPLQPTSFIGRQRELRELPLVLNRGSTRLLTLTGPGGVGKTRLALQVAEYVLDHFPDGVVFVSLASLADPGQVAATIASVLGIREMSGLSPLDVITLHFRSKKMLLVLDNFEHLLSASDVVSHLAASCPHLKCMVTSRTVLHLAAERAYPVSPLAVPTPQHLPDVSVLSRYDAVLLFEQRAQAAKPDFHLSEENAAAVAEICWRLDGLPLAIELAAARVTFLPPQALLIRLENRLQVLIGGPRDVPNRQQTLRNTIDWSYSLLDKNEQTLLSRLSVFADGCTLEAAEAVCGMGGVDDVFAALVSLVDQSLVTQEGEDEPRFRMLETIRDYATGQLQSTGQRDAIRRRHAEYYLQLVENRTKFIRNDDEQGLSAGDNPKLANDPELHQRRWLVRMERELENLRAAMAWCLQTTQSTDRQVVDIGLRLAGGLHRFWLFRDHREEALAWLQQMLAHSADLRTAARARALYSAGYFASIIGDLARSRDFLEQSVQLWRDLDNERNVSVALAVLGSTNWGSEGEQQATSILEESLALARALGEPWWIGHALLHSVFRVVNSTEISRADARARARASGFEGLKCLRSAGDAMTAAVMEFSLGRIALYEGDCVEAKSMFRACLPVFRRMGWRSTAADALVGLADALRDQGIHDEAGEIYREALILYRDVGQHLASAVARTLCTLAEMELQDGNRPAAQMYAVETLVSARDTGGVGVPEIERALLVQAALLAAQGSPMQAWRLAGAEAALHDLHNPQNSPSDHAAGERGGTCLPPSPQVSYGVSNRDTLYARLGFPHDLLSADEQVVAWTQGLAMSQEEAIACALE